MREQLETHSPIQAVEVNHEGHQSGFLGVSWLRRFQLEQHATDSTKISCSNCGKYFGAYLDLRNAAMDAPKAKVESMMKDILKRR